MTLFARSQYAAPGSTREPVPEPSRVGEQTMSAVCGALLDTADAQLRALSDWAALALQLCDMLTAHAEQACKYATRCYLPGTMSVSVFWFYLLVSRFDLRHKNAGHLYLLVCSN